jgi:mRNA-degrading endonuclease RelE of RelBE toxin-antitoxin system
MPQFFTVLRFIKSLDELDSEVQKQIKTKLAFLSAQENPLLFAKRLKGHKDIFRFRSGDFRIVFQLTGTKITLLFVKHRKDVYMGL